MNGRLLMDANLPDNWPEIPRKVFHSFITDCVFDYRREAWGNAIVYLRRSDNEPFAYLLNDGRVLVHPDLAK